MEYNVFGIASVTATWGSVGLGGRWETSRVGPAVLAWRFKCP